MDGVPVHCFQYGRAVADNHRVEEERQTVEAGRVFADAPVVIVRYVSAVRVFGPSFYVSQIIVPVERVTGGAVQANLRFLRDEEYIFPEYGRIRIAVPRIGRDDTAVYEWLRLGIDMQEVSFDQRVLARTGYVDIGGKKCRCGSHADGWHH